MEYEKILKALKAAYSSERQLMLKCSNLNADLETNKGRLEKVLTMSEADQLVVETLKKVINRASGYANYSKSVKGGGGGI